jgi:uncharacterized protein YecT (DUF1311 family)
MTRSHLSGLVAIVIALTIAAASTSVLAQTQSDLNVTASQTAREAQAQLDKAVQTYRRRLTTQQKRMFDLSQRRWEVYRHAACEFQASGAAGGSVHPMVIDYCWRDYTMDRLKVLNYLLTCTEGDLSCPEFEHGT